MWKGVSIHQLASRRSARLRALHDSKHKFFGISSRVHLNGIALPDLASQKPLRERVLNVSLDGTAKGARPKLGAVSQIHQAVFRGIPQANEDFAIRQERV